MAEALADQSPHFEYHPEYPQLAGGAGRKAAPQIGTPAIIRQLVFRMPEELADTPEKWEPHILNYIRRIANQVRQPGTPPVEIEELGGPSIRYKTFRVAFSWESIPVEMSFVLHSEYLTLSTSMDLSGRTGEMHGLEGIKLADALSVVNGVLTERYRKVSETKSRVDRERDRTELKKHYHTIYHEIWDKFYNEFLVQPYRYPGNYLGPRETPSLGLGKIDLDLRHLLLSRGEGKNFIALPGAAPRNPLLAK